MKSKNNIIDEAIRKFKRQAKTVNEILAFIHDLQGFVGSKLIDAKVLIDTGKEKWIKLQDVQKLLDEVNEKYFLIPKEKFIKVITLGFGIKPEEVDIEKIEELFKE